MLRGEHESIGQEAGPANQGAFGSDPGELRAIVALGQMSEDDISRLAVVTGFKKLARRFIRKVTYAGKYALFYRPGIRAIPKHFEVVIGFKQEQVDAFELRFDVGSDVTEIGGQSHAHAFSLKDKTDGIGGVVGNREGTDGNVPNLKRASSLEVFNGGQPSGIDFRLVFFGGDGFAGGIAGSVAEFGVLCCVDVHVVTFALGGRGGGFSLARSGFLATLLDPLGVGHLAARGEPAQPGAMSSLGEVDGNAEFAGGDGEAADVILVLVGNDDGIERGGIFTGEFHAAEEFSATEASVDEDAGVAARDNCAVAL